MEKKNPCIAMVPCPGASHLIPHIEFAKRLVCLQSDFHVTLLIPTLGPPSPTMHSVLQSLPPSIHFTILPQVNMEDLPHADPATLMLLTVTRSLPSLKHALTSLSSETHLVALVADSFSVDALDIAKQLNLSSYIYQTSSATALSFCLYYPKLEDDKIIVSRKHGELLLSEPLKIPGCVPFQAKDLSDLIQDKATDFNKTLIHMCKRLHLADGILVNTFVDLESEPMRALQDKDANANPPVYPVGPIVQNKSSIPANGSNSQCLAWLDDQPRKSVLYVSFGSGGTLSHEQFNELAFGLEMSGHRFLWVVKAPSSSADSAYLSAQKEDPLEHLPKGFKDRTKGQGFVVSSWAPQIEVMSHGSTGGFLTHCGWNSTLESVVYGKPLIAWPLFAEQRINALMVTDVFKVAVRPQVSENGIVKREEVARVVKCLMESDEGKEMGRRIQGFKDAATNALGKDGSSTKTLEAVALKWKNSKT